MALHCITGATDVCKLKLDVSEIACFKAAPAETKLSSVTVNAQGQV